MSTFGTSTTAIVVTTASPCDAAAGNYVAGVLKAPVLYTAPGNLPAPTASALATLHVQSVLVLGGTLAVSDAVVNQLKGTGYAVTRIAGSDVWLPLATLDALHALGIRHVLILGGPLAVPSSVDSSLSSLSSLGITSERLAGTDVLSTAVVVAGRDDGFDRDHRLHPRRDRPDDQCRRSGHVPVPVEIAAGQPAGRGIVAADGLRLQRGHRCDVRDHRGVGTGRRHLDQRCHLDRGEALVGNSALRRHDRSDRDADEHAQGGHNLPRAVPGPDDRLPRVPRSGL